MQPPLTPDIEYARMILHELDEVRKEVQTILDAIDSIRAERPPLKDWPLKKLCEREIVLGFKLLQFLNRQNSDCHPYFPSLERID